MVAYKEFLLSLQGARSFFRHCEESKGRRSNPQPLITTNFCVSGAPRLSLTLNARDDDGKTLLILIGLSKFIHIGDFFPLIPYLKYLTTLKHKNLIAKA